MAMISRRGSASPPAGCFCAPRRRRPPPQPWVSPATWVGRPPGSGRVGRPCRRRGPDGDRGDGHSALEPRQYRHRLSYAFCACLLRPRRPSTALEQGRGRVRPPKLTYSHVKCAAQMRCPGTLGSTEASANQPSVQGSAGGYWLTPLTLLGSRCSNKEARAQWAEHRASRGSNLARRGPGGSSRASRLKFDQQYWFRPFRGPFSFWKTGWRRSALHVVARSLLQALGLHLSVAPLKGRSPGLGCRGLATAKWRDGDIRPILEVALPPPAGDAKSSLQVRLPPS
jgi:hypothetical protein